MKGRSRSYADAALAWALSRVGERAPPWRCLAFVEDAYERANAIEVFGGDSANESALRYGTTRYDASAPPPTGAFVFYASAGPVDGVPREWGHVGLAVGDGRVVHALEVVRLDDAREIEHLVLGAGWSKPRLMGWTHPDRILEGHRRRDWGRPPDG